MFPLTAITHEVLSPRGGGSRASPHWSRRDVSLSCSPRPLSTPSWRGAQGIMGLCGPAASVAVPPGSPSPERRRTAAPRLVFQPPLLLPPATASRPRMFYPRVDDFQTSISSPDLSPAPWTQLPHCLLHATSWLSNGTSLQYNPN